MRRLLTLIIGAALLLAVFVPLSVRRYATASR